LTLIPAMHGQQATTEPEPVSAISVGLAPGDTLTVHFLDFPEAAELAETVKPGGTIFVPYVGQVKVAGLMPDEAEQAIVDALKARQVVASPQVSLNVVSARNLSVMVIGQVGTPRPIPLFAPAPLSMVLSLAGGMTPLASYHVLIAHRDGTPPVDVEVDRTLSNLTSLNAIVNPGDIVAVLQAGSFFALGELNRPGIFPITGTQHLTLLQALAIGGGTTPNASLSRARILRTVNGHREEIDVDLGKLREGKVADPMIQTDDILFVPKSFTKVLLNSWLNQSLYAVALGHEFGVP
jgi:polysaccharide export outer membrane protein